MLVSVIIPVYNAAKTLLRCVESVVVSIERITQDYEIICINDGSTDNSFDICKEIAKKNERIVVIHQENAGAASARNKGLELAKGEYIAFNDSDDEWMENHFEVLLSILSQHRCIDCVSSSHETEFQSTCFIKKIDDNLYKTTLKSQLLRNYFSPQTTILRRSIIDSGVRFVPGMRYAEEGFFFNWIAKDFNACFFNKKLSQSILHKQRFGDGGLSGNLKEMEQGELYNIKYAYDQFGISLFYYVICKSFSILKYFRRIIIVKIRKSKIK